MSETPIVQSAVDTSVDTSWNGEAQFLPVNGQLWSRNQDQDDKSITQTDGISAMVMPGSRRTAVMLSCLVSVKLSHASNQVVAIAVTLATSSARACRACSYKLEHCDGDTSIGSRRER